VDTAPQEEKTETRHEWTVRPGDRLSLLLTRVYGHSDKGLIERVLRHNPHIRDANTILVGDTIVLPRFDGTDETKSGDSAVSSP
jgi:phage tail protein X